MQTNTTTADRIISDADAVNAAIAAINNRVTQKPTVPIAIHLICVITAIVLGLSALAVWILEPFVAVLAVWIPDPFVVVNIYFWVYVNIAVAANLVAIIGMWKMKKWGAYLYAAVFVIGVVYLIYVELWFFNIGFVINLAASGTALFYSGKMK